MALTKEQTERLKEGDTLRYTTYHNYGKNHIDAEVKVIAIGLYGLLVEVVKVISKGEKNNNCEGARLFANFEDLTIPENEGGL
jgi:hypothetical protein